MADAGPTSAPGMPKRSWRLACSSDLGIATSAATSSPTKRGRGRPKGSKNKKTLEKEAAMRVAAAAKTPPPDGDVAGPSEPARPEKLRPGRAPKVWYITRSLSTCFDPFHLSSSASLRMKTLRLLRIRRRCVAVALARSRGPRHLLQELVQQTTMKSSPPMPLQPAPHYRLLLRLRRSALVARRRRRWRTRSRRSDLFPSVVTIAWYPSPMLVVRPTLPAVPPDYAHPSQFMYIAQGKCFGYHQYVA
jgi:hypothetical protein